jgi:capsid portal protein
MVVGDGFIPMKGKANTLLTTSMKGEVITDDSLNEIEDVISQVNLHGQNLQEVLAQLAFDYDAFGNSFCEIVKGKVGSEPFTYIYHVPVYNIGIRKAEADQIIKSVGIYDNWEEVPLTTDGVFYESEGFREVPMYPDFKKFEDGTQRSVIHVKQYAAGYFYFGLPEWIGAKMWAEMEYRIQRFNTSKFENGFMPSGIMQFFGSITPAEAKKLVEGIESKFTGMANNHKLFVQVLRDEKLKANWIPTSKENEGEFLNLQNLAASAIVVANRWSKSLAGFATAGQLGSNQQIRQEMEYLQSTVIKPRQNLMLSKIINPYLAEIGLYNPALKDVQFSISNTLPVSFMGDIAVEDNLTQDEKREILGYSPIEINEPINTTI